MSVCSMQSSAFYIISSSFYLQQPTISNGQVPLFINDNSASCLGGLLMQHHRALQPHQLRDMGEVLKCPAAAQRTNGDRHE